MIARRLTAIGINREVVVLSLARTADAFCNSLLIVLIPLYVIRMPRGPLFASLPELTLVGIVISLSGLTYALTQPLAAGLADASGRRKPFIIAGLGLLALVTLGFIPARSYSALIVLRMLQGLSIAFTIPTALALINDYADRRSLGGSMGVFTTARMIGFALGPLVGGLVMETVGFSAAFVVGALGAVVSMILVWLYVPEVTAREEAAILPSPVEESRDESAERRGSGATRALTLSPVTDTEAWLEEEKEPAAAAPTDAIPPGRLRWIMRQLYIIGAAVFVMALSVGLISALEPELNRRLAQNAIGFGIAFSMLTVARLIFQIPLGHLSDRIGRKGLIVGGMLLMAPLTLLQGFAPTTFLLSIDRFLLGAASAMIVGPVYAMAADRAVPGRTVRQMSILTIAFGLGVAAGPLMAGIVAGMSSFEMPFVAGGILNAVAGLIVLFFVRESLPARQPATPEQV